MFFAEQPKAITLETKCPARRLLPDNYRKPAGSKPSGENQSGKEAASDLTSLYRVRFGDRMHFDIMAYKKNSHWKPPVVR